MRDLARQELNSGATGKCTIVAGECTCDGDSDLYLVRLGVDSVVGTGVNGIDRCSNTDLVTGKAFSGVVG